MTYAAISIGANTTILKPVVTGGTLYSDSTYYYRKFTASGTFSVSQASLVIDILAIGGGGGGGPTNTMYVVDQFGNLGVRVGGGGGAGGVLLMSNVAYPAGNSSFFIIGGGGTGISTPSGGGGTYTGGISGQFIVGYGGGHGWAGTTAAEGGQVGHGGGGYGQVRIYDQANQSVNGSTGVDGNINGILQTGNTGGSGYATPNDSTATGGGGAGDQGNGLAPAQDTVKGGIWRLGGGQGGSGTAAYSSWMNATSSGVSGIIAGGGGGGTNYNWPTGGTGGTGGGGNGGNAGSPGSNGTANTGSGGGGGSMPGSGGTMNGGNGGSGLLIVRYTKAQVD